MTKPVQLTSRQWVVVLLIAAVQFINILDFVMVMPLGPDLSKALGIDEAQLGWISGSYTAAACLSGLIGSVFLDRFDRRKALAVALVGLVTGTAAGAWAVDEPSLLLARVLAGTFGGPATSVAFSIIADTIPAAVRGRAMGAVMGSFSIASIVGVPLGLWLAEAVSWRAPFIAVAVLGVVVCVGVLLSLPPMTSHLVAHRQPPGGFRLLLMHPVVQTSYLMTAVVMMAGFVLIPNIASHVQLNLHFPRESLKYAYGVGGVASLFATQLGGRAVDRFGSLRVGTVGSILVLVTVFSFFVVEHAALPQAVVLLLFVGFMTANGLRNVAYNTLTTKVPPPELRARFQSLQSAIQHGASAAAALLSSQWLRTVQVGPVKRLEGMEKVAWASMALTALIPWFLRAVERHVARRP